MAASDKSLLEANDHLIHLVEELALTNEKLLEANEQLGNSEKIQKEFINIAAHELRTPITPILVSLHLAKRVKTADGASQTILAEDQAEMIVRNAKRLEKLANDILTVARIEGKGLKLHKEPVELNEEIRHATSDAKTLVPLGKNIDFIFEPSKEAIIVDVDKSKLFEVLSNLIKNAIRFMDEPQGKITVRLSKEKQDETADGNSSVDMMAVITINDNGMGIDPKILPRIFQKFVASSDFGATGLGLYVSKSIVDAHNGKIWGEDNKDGKGATFRFTLPLKP